jgi:hypothetical protein
MGRLERAGQGWVCVAWVKNVNQLSNLGGLVRLSRGSLENLMLHTAQKVASAKAVDLPERFNSDQYVCNGSRGMDHKAVQQRNHQSMDSLGT